MVYPLEDISLGVIGGGEHIKYAFSLLYYVEMEIGYSVREECLKV